MKNVILCTQYFTCSISQCGNCGHGYSNAWKPKHCPKCSFEIGGTYVPKAKRQKLHAESPKCIVVVDSSELKIFSVALSSQHNRVFVVQSGPTFVCHSEKCKVKRAVHVASDISFSCDHTNHVQSCSDPNFAKNLKEEDINLYKCDHAMQTMLMDAIHPPQDFRHVVQISDDCYAVYHGASQGPSNPTGYCHVQKTSGEWRCSNRSCTKKSGNSKQLKVRHICPHLHVLFCVLRMSSTSPIPADTTLSSTSTVIKEQETPSVGRSSTIALNMKRVIPYPLPREILSAGRSLTDDIPSSFVPCQSNCVLCGSPLSGGRRHPGQGHEDLSYLITPWIFRPVDIQVKICINKDCKAMHQVWPIDKGLFNICDKILVAIEILENWRQLFQRGVPLSIAIESSVSVWVRCGQVQLNDNDLKYINSLLYNGFYAFELLSERSLDNVVCGICGVIGQVHFGDGNEKNCCSIDLALLIQRLQVLYSSLLTGSSPCHGFTHVAGNTGGFYHMVCRHGTTVASKFLLLQESVRDAVDLYLSLKCPPVVLVNDTPCGFARHLDLREPTVGSELWGDCVGCFQRPDPDTEPKEVSVPEIVPSEFSSNNLSEGRLRFDLANPLQHPLTGSTRRYVVGDRFHTTTNPHKSNLCAYHDINLCLQSDTIKTSYQECQNNSKNIKRLRCSTMQSFPVHFLYNFLMDFYHNENIVEKQRKQLSLTLKEGQVLQRDKFLRFVVLDNRNY